MRHKLYIAYDNVSEEVFGNIIRANNHETARRSFYEALADTNGPMAKNAKDYRMLCIGTLETTTGAIHRDDNTLAETAEIIASGADWIAANTEKPL